MILDRLVAFLQARQVGWLDVLDVLIVAFIIYELLQFIRGTHAVQMALGAVVLVIAYFTSQWLNLQTVNWMMRTFLPYLVFGIIVVFQAEIRKVLAHIGKAPLLGAFASERRGDILDEVVLAATTLAQASTGAIMVLEREIGLRSYIETGIQMDAVVTYDLLVNIFKPGTPLHDGAAILQGGRIAAAACFLPLTVNPELSTQLGSRHRAAIGVTEDTDALVVVVSEETGQISLVQSGRIQRGLDGRALRVALKEALEFGDEQRPPEDSKKPAATRDELGR